MSMKLPGLVEIFIGENLAVPAVVQVFGGTALFPPILLTFLKLFFSDAYGVPIANPFIGFAPKHIGAVSVPPSGKSAKR